jgi:hypothetical protein
MMDESSSHPVGEDAQCWLRLLAGTSCAATLELTRARISGPVALANQREIDALRIHRGSFRSRQERDGPIDDQQTQLGRRHC